MKNFFLYVLLMALLVLSGCFNRSNEETSTGTGELQINNEFSIQLNGSWIALKDWDNQIDLLKILGEPVYANTEKLGFGSDTFEGSFVKELDYTGLNLELFSPNQLCLSVFIGRI